MVAADGIEPPTRRASTYRSTSELNGQDGASGRIRTDGHGVAARCLSHLATEAWQGLQDSNSWHSVLETDVLPTELNPCENKRRPYPMVAEFWQVCWY